MSSWISGIRTRQPSSAPDPGDSPGSEAAFRSAGEQRPDPSSASPARHRGPARAPGAAPLPRRASATIPNLSLRSFFRKAARSDVPRLRDSSFCWRSPILADLLDGPPDQGLDLGLEVEGPGEPVLDTVQDRLSLGFGFGDLALELAQGFPFPGRRPSSRPPSGPWRLPLPPGSGRPARCRSRPSFSREASPAGSRSPG